LLLRPRHVDDQRAVCGAADVERPWVAADVAVANELAFALRVDVDVDGLEAVGARDLGNVVHLAPHPVVQREHSEAEER